MSSAFVLYNLYMRNTYFLLRHGESAANVAHIIDSDARKGEHADYRLTPLGETQVHDTITAAKERGELGSDTLIFSSPFARCRQTAEIAKDILGVTTGVEIDRRLRERWFGDFEKTFLDNYKKVWAADKIDPGHTIEHVESANDVQARALEVVRDLEDRYTGQTILLVSHGDTLQTLLTGLAGESAGLHRDIPHIGVGELRKVA